jgi:hypothetical protein
MKIEMASERTRFITKFIIFPKTLLFGVFDKDIGCFGRIKKTRFLSKVKIFQRLKGGAWVDESWGDGAFLFGSWL